MSNVFRAGQKVKIYQKPLIFQELEGEATLMSFVRPVPELEVDGLIVEEWVVRFDNEEELFTRLVAGKIGGVR